MVGINISCESSVVADHEQWWNAKKSSKNAFLWEHLNQMINFISVNFRMNIFEISYHSHCCSSVFYLKNVHETLVKIFIIQNQKNDRGFLLFINHCKRPMSKLSAWICLCMDASYLVEFLSYKISNNRSSTFSKQKDIILSFENLCQFLILFNIIWL